MSVYFVTCRDASAVKIGNSVSPHLRLPELQAYCPLPLVLEAILPGASEEEHDFHRRFSDVRIRGEWFTINEMIEAIIAANPAGPAPASSKNAPRMPMKETWQQREDRQRTEYAESIRRARQRQINNRIASGDIHFPFRPVGDSRDAQPKVASPLSGDGE